MKVKILIFFMVLVLVSGLQPIFAAEPQAHDTKIAGPDGKPLKNIYTTQGDLIKIKARLYEYIVFSGKSSIARWNYRRWRYLDFFVCKENPDGSSGDLLWYGSALTSFFTGNACPGSFTLNDAGTYNLIIQYKGKLKNCVSISKIYVV